MVKPMVHSVKHYTHHTLFGVAIGTLTAVDLAKAKNVVDVNAANEIKEGSLVKAVYIEFWITGDDAVQSSFSISLEKVNDGDNNIMTFAQSVALFGYPNKKNIFYETMGLSPPNTQNPMTPIRGWYKIPKGKQRFGFGDQLRVNISAINDGLTVCGFTTYKEYD